MDDSKTNLDILINILSDKFDIIPTLDGQTALDIAKKEKIDLILLDIMMPNIDGFTVCKMIKENKPTSNIPILFLTAKGETEDIQKGFDLGAVDYITKPFNPTELLIRVKNNIELSGYKLDLEKRVQEEITKTKEAQNFMLQQSKLAEMGEMINMIAHQWRQPLGAIGSAVIAVDFTIKSGKYNLEYKNERDELLSFINNKNQRINDSIEFLTNTIDDFRNFYKKDREKESVNITIPIIKTLDIVQLAINNNGINIITNFKTDAKINIYKNELMQVILNILKNSEDNFIIKNINNPKINISTKKENNNYIISIEDNGGGIKTDIIDNIFDPYFSTKHEKNGTGLGLYMSKIIIETHHNGKLIVNNTSNGVCFDIII